MDQDRNSHESIIGVLIFSNRINPEEKSLEDCIFIVDAKTTLPYKHETKAVQSTTEVCWSE